MEIAPENVTNAMVNKKIAYVDMDHTLCDLIFLKLSIHIAYQGFQRPGTDAKFY